MGDFLGTVDLQFLAWDQTDGHAAGTYVNLSSPGATGGSTAYSTASSTALLQVTTPQVAPSFTLVQPADTVLENYADSNNPGGGDAGVIQVSNVAKNISLGTGGGNTVSFSVTNPDGDWSIRPSTSTANRNRAAKIDNGRPQFPKDYDRREEARVVEAFGGLTRHQSEVAWEERVRQSGDRGRRSIMLLSMFRSSNNLAIAIVAAFLTIAMADDAPEDAPEDQGNRVVTLIEELVSRNAPPRLVKTTRSTLPAFSTDYDWDDQKRVRRAFAALSKERSTEIWEILLKHAGDSRYAITVAPNGNHDLGRNYSVGGICQLIAYHQLIDVATNRPGVAGSLDLGERDLRKWRAAREKKELYELQIEVCGLAIEKVLAADDVSSEQRIEVRRELERDVAQLKETKKPIFRRFSMSYYEVYDAEAARDIRNELPQQ